MKRRSGQIVKEEETEELHSKKVKSEDLDDPIKKEEDSSSKQYNQSNERIKCPYLDTINRQLIDFDSEKLCSVTLTNMNVYVCLVCGKFFQGRGKSTPAFTHSVQAGHFVFMNLQSSRAYCLPDGYEVVDSSLQDVAKCLSPKFSLEDIAALNTNTSLARDVHGISYLPGFIGLNNLNCTDYLNVVLHALGHITPFRDFWLTESNYALCKSNLVHQFGLTMRKMWSPHNFKCIVSPQELMQVLAVESKKRFSIGSRADCLDLLVWLLAALNKGLGQRHGNAGKTVKTNGKKPGIQSVPSIYDPFQGIIEVTSMTKQLVDSANDLLEAPTEADTEGWTTTVTEVPFRHLSLDIPPCPLFRDSEGGLVIPQIPLFQVLKKFDGSSWSDHVTKEAHVRKRYRIKTLPRYLVLHLVRFTRNNFYLEKNPTIINFPLKNLEMRDYIAFDETNSHQLEGQRLIENCPPLEQLPSMDPKQLIALIQALGIEHHLSQMSHILSQANGDLSAHKAEVLVIATQVVERILLLRNTKYDLLANICHDSTAAAGSGGGAKHGVSIGDTNMGSALGSTSAAAARAKARALAAAKDGAAVSLHSANNDVLAQGEYKVHIQHKATGQWFEIQDLHVTEAMPQLIGVSESCLLIYEKKDLLGSKPVVVHNTNMDVDSASKTNT